MSSSPVSDFILTMILLDVVVMGLRVIKILEQIRDKEEKK